VPDTITENFGMRNLAIALSLIAFAVPLAPAVADDVTDQINEAVSAYSRKDVPTAIAGLEAALNLLRQGRADAYGKLLPAPPPGWTADDVETISVGVMIAGGGTGATRKYHQGDSTVTVSIMADSPIMQAMSALASSGVAAAAGLRTQIINGRRMLFTKDDNAFMTILADRILVRVEGGGVPEATLKQFLTAIDFAAVEKLGH
jgi:hypothetical protein